MKAHTLRAPAWALRLQQRFAPWLGAVVAAVVMAGPAAAQSAAPATAAAPAAAMEYRLGAGDVVRISVFQNPELSLETRVTDAGTISFPLLGAVKVADLSVTQAERAIAEGLRNGNFVRNPQVTLLLVQVRGHQASVLGQVNRPGRYPLESAGMRVSELLALAGGVAGSGSDQLVLVGQRNGQPFRQEVDLPRLFAPGGASLDITVANGDILWVERQPLVYIYGEVQRPGPMRLERNLTLMQALATGGGLTQRGTAKGIRVHRKAPDGTVQVLETKMDDTLREGDVVYVRESLF